MNVDIDTIAEMPLVEPINTMTDKRRENRKHIGARLRKSPCAKLPYSKKQAITAASYHMSRGVPYIGTYKCPKRACGHWHLTHKKPRR